MDFENLYREQLLEHYHHPRNAKPLLAPDFSAVEQNPSCGDQIRIEGCIEDGMIKELGFVGAGCMLSQAAASMVTEACKGKTVEQVLSLNKDFIIGLIGIQVGPTRLRCALLSLSSLQQGLISYLAKGSRA